MEGMGMGLEMILKGVIIGFLIAVPVGPIGVLCIRRTLADGWRVGLATGLGAATADAMYGSIAAFGLTVLTGALMGGRTWMALAGGLFLVYLGVRTFLSRPKERTGELSNGKNKGTFRAYVSTFFLTVTNPLTILSFAAVFAGWSIDTRDDYVNATLLVTGVFAGSAAWWLVLSGSVSLLRRKLRPATLLWVNRISGAIITAFGVAALASTLT
jgi:threonine/homoserine/homoserine lactone efflux protein